MKKNETRLYAIVAIILAALACIAAWLVVPPIQSFFFPTLDSSTIIPLPIETSTQISRMTAPPVANQTPISTENAIETNSDGNLSTATSETFIAVASDIPGTPIKEGITYKSVVDADIKPRDVYSVELIAGQTVYVTMKTNGGWVWMNYANPGFPTFEKSDGNYLSGMGNDYKASFTAAVSGTYYIAVIPRDTGILYTISITIGNADIIEVVNDVPGTPIQAGIPYKSVVDAEIKPRDVYSVELTAGQTVYVTMKTNGGWVWMNYANPGFPTFEKSDGNYLSGMGNDYKASFTAAVSGTYYIAVIPKGTGTLYTIFITITNP